MGGGRPRAWRAVPALLVAVTLSLAWAGPTLAGQGDGADAPGRPAHSLAAMPESAADAQVAKDTGGVADESARAFSTFTFTQENDSIAGSDRDYTNGFKLHWISADLGLYARDHWLPALLTRSLKALPFLDDPALQYNLAFSLSQIINTPRATAVPWYLPNERPYAGWTNLALALHAKTPTVLDTFELGVGIVGPASLAADVQNTVHDILGIRRAQGWSHQLSNEPTLQLTWQRTLRLYRRELPGNLALDVLPHAGVTAGNVLVAANAGVEMRFGYELPWDFGTTLIRPGGGVSAPAASGDPRLERPARPGVHFFVGAQGRAVARNLFLDGNTFVPSHSIPKLPFTADLMAGVGVLYGPFKLTYAHILRTPEYRQQDGPQYFGSLSLSVTF